MSGVRSRRDSAALDCVPSVRDSDLRDVVPRLPGARHPSVGVVT